MPHSFAHCAMADQTNIGLTISRKVNETTYRLLPKTEEQALKKRQKYCQWEVEKCEHCDGKGEVYISIEELYEQDLEMQRDLRFE